MSSIQSLGLHEPSGLPYLVAESVLPADPQPSLYKWSVSQVPDETNSSLVEEEILRTDRSVVWSRNGAIKRALNLDVEGESILHTFVTQFGDELDDKKHQHGEQTTSLERGLVVVLKTQAHIFLLSGDSYVLPLSFEVESAFSFPCGFLLQRRLGDSELSNHIPTLRHDLSTINETLTSIGADSSRPSLVLPESHSTPRLLKPTADGMPRTFSFTEVMSELGLVVWSPHRKGESLDACNALPRAEKLMFISGVPVSGSVGLTNRPVCVALTFNETTSNFTLWHVAQGPVADLHKQKVKKDGNSKSRASLRKSSNVYGRDTGHLRESLLGSRQGYVEAGPFSSLEDRKSFPANDLASQLGPEFGDFGPQTRSARRVSSMLARTDLGSAVDRNTFTDLAMGHAGRQSLNRAGKRGESIGSFNDRQSFGFRRRSSFPTNASNFSTSTSFLDVSAHELLEDMDPLRQSTRLEEDTFATSESNLPRTIGFFKVKSFTRSQASASSLEVKVFLLNGPYASGQDSGQTKEVYLCLMDTSTQEMTLIRVLVKSHVSSTTPKQKAPKPTFELKVAEVRRLPGIKDACVVVDGPIERLVVLTQSRSQMKSLQLEAPWSPSFQIELPKSYALHNPFLGSLGISPRKDKDTGSRRTIPGKDVQIEGLLDAGVPAQLFLVDQNDRRHSMGIHLTPRDALVRRTLQVCGLVLGPKQEETLLVAFWDVSTWLHSRDPPLTSEWTAMVVVLFSLAVPFISKQEHKSTPTRRKKAALLRSSSSSAIDLTNYDLMQNEAHGITLDSGTRASAWDWLSQGPLSNAKLSPKTRHARTSSTASFHDHLDEKKDSYLIGCVALAREYTQSPLGEAALGPEGYLPTSINKDREQRCNTIPSILLGLHLLYEESKLNVASAPNIKGSKHSLVLVLAQLGRWLGWKDWTSDGNTYYEHESAEVKSCSYNDSAIDGLRIPAQPFLPPSIFQHLENCIHNTSSSSFLTLARVSGMTEPIQRDDPRRQMMAKLTPRTLAILSFLDRSRGQRGAKKTVDLLLQSDLSEHELSTLPDGVAAVFYQGIASKHFGLDKNARSKTQQMLGLESENQKGYDASHPSNRQQVLASHEAVRDYHTVCSSAIEAETLQRWDASSEADRQAITRLIFSEDRRFQEASKIVNQTRPPLVECTPEPDWSEVDLLEAQKELAQYAARRTLSVAAGRGMMHFTARVPLLTERVPIPAFSLQCVMKPRNASESTQAMTFSADKATFTEEKVCWAFFHNGASMGLMISNDAQAIDTSWILYNKPPELTNRHAGFLLALGLNGHLKSLAKWVAFKYLTPKHTMTSVGLLLGLSASFLGTMDTLITRLLSVHVTRLLPPGAAELNLSPLTQTTGIMGIGLLYHNSQHRRMSEVLLSEIENNDSEEGIVSENVLRDEGYRLAAGFSLGLINLGQGKRLHGLHDVGVVERLLTIAVGTKNVNMVHVLDRATAGAVMALAFVFLKTNDTAIAQKVDVPDTLHQFDYVRPDIFLLRTLARHLIMWDSIQPTHEFVKASLPKAYRFRSDLRSTKALSTEDMPFFNIIAGICFAIGLRFAGSQRDDVRDLLVSYLDQFLRLSRLPALNYDARVTLNSVRNCLDALALAAASVMAGSGDLQVMRRLRALHGRIDKETPFGSHLAAHMALGALFLAGGTRTFGTSNLGIAALCIAFYPVFPNDVLDNRGHLQALRHLWVLAVEGRCLVARDGGAGGSVVGGATALVHMKDGGSQSIRLPGLIPEFDAIKAIDITGEGFWDGHIDFTLEREQLLAKFKKENAVNFVLRRRAAYDRPPKDLFTSELQARAEMMGIPSVDPNAVPSYAHTGSIFASQATKNSNPFDWLFSLDALKDFDHAERALAMSPVPLGGKEILRTTVVDSRLEFEKSILPPDVVTGRMEKDKLWQLRLLFAWFDRWEREDEEAGQRQVEHQTVSDGDGQGEKWFSESGGTWLRKEVIERLRWRVWNMTTGGAGEREGVDDIDEDM
ncbi:Anaphase-promoting complex subunit 1 [Cladophialophora chaetospira]|uniref:Anaphase-promoting complex subunit 1 n=1 Tax=Cladophialophora chaetospira TaxID=386627 RepID=A0AA38XDR0_9EURO|nr:Anaphase-promoting complex subunit 1 [Cladophialophora chaetospira]